MIIRFLIYLTIGYFFYRFILDPLFGPDRKNRFNSGKKKNRRKYDDDDVEDADWEEKE